MFVRIRVWHSSKVCVCGVRDKVARVADFLCGAKDECKQQRNAIYASIAFEITILHHIM